MTDLADLRYPIGRFAPPAASLPGIRAAADSDAAPAPRAPARRSSGLNDAQLDTPYREGGWTVRQVVHHLADSHAMAYIRCKLALTEDWPTINPYDEAAWANLPDSRSLPVEVSLAMIERAARALGGALRSAHRRGVPEGLQPSRAGRQTLAKALAIYDWHSRHHTAHITSLRARQGW